MNLISIKDTVETILRQAPATRDNDNLLILKVWAQQNPKLRESTAQFWDFAKMFIEGKYASTESIRRVRQKMQEIHPELRGKKYQARHAEQDSVKEQLKNIQS